MVNIDNRRNPRNTDSKTKKKPARKLTEGILKEADIRDPVSLYKLFVTDKVLSHIVEATNMYAQCCSMHNSSVEHFMCNDNWDSLTVEELRIFLFYHQIKDILLYNNIKDMWCTENIIIKGLTKKITKTRYYSILNHLYFNTVKESIGSDTDPAIKITKVIHMITRNFKRAVKVGHVISIDESVLTKDGKIIIDHSTDGKCIPHRVDVFKMCSKDGYTFDWGVLVSAQSACIDIDRINHVINKLLSGLLYKKKRVYTGSRITNFILANTLLAQSTYLCGKVVANAEYLPTDRQYLQKKGDYVTLSNLTGIKLFKWTNNYTRFMLSTFKEHRGRVVNIYNNSNNIDVGEDYDKSTQGISLTDHIETFYNSTHKISKWYRTVILHLMCNTAISNAWYIYRTFTTGSMTLLEFKICLVEDALGIEMQLDIDFTKDHINMWEKYFSTWLADE
ncbi:hypothetical protein NEPAR04_0031 [Nematocida parisii]|nr:hypothetical protein NEPAR03_0526 [Nematocida parisii]KAI5128278.1 hypothetical protein NEPAR08_1142 [Nematocida parisii]KAI5140057.1 hypothetical protein NEPAR04_0031 [Nematocida parisii]